MTLINGKPMANASGAVQNSISKIEGLLQTNNDIMLSIHKAFMEYTIEINRKVDSLHDQVLELKRSVLQTTQQGLSDESAKWRSYTQQLLTQMLHQHGKDSSLLVDLLKLSIHEQPKKVDGELKGLFQPSALERKNGAFGEVLQPKDAYTPLVLDQPKKMVRFQLPAPAHQVDGVHAAASAISTVGEPENHSSDDEDSDLQNDDDYEPVVPLPALVELKTGEEDEEVLFDSVCKLYRFDCVAKENKERGAGEIKILRNKQNNRYRCVMRRDMILNICANFPIHPLFKISQKPNMPTVYTWHCMDYSDEPEGVGTILLAKFKDKEIALEFANKLSEIVESLKL